MNIATVPPPLIYLASGLLGILVDELLPSTARFDDWIRITGAALGVVSLGVLPPVLSRFRSARTPFDVRKTPSTLVTSGPFRVSRNPSYLGLTLLYVGISVAASSVGMLVLAVVPVAVLNRWVIPLEEQRLSGEFGEAYERYCASVRRWI
jgi:protein-S-isoprenylcysteine O-methyltransferase Ste14